MKMRDRHQVVLLGSRIALPVLVLILTTFLYGQFGFQGKLNRDDANLLYSSQRMAEGIPPYISIFNHTVPIPPLLGGLGVAISKKMGWNDLYTVRFLFFVIGCLTAVSIYFLGLSLFRSQRIGFIVALVFIQFFPFAQSAISGPQKKVPMVLFEVLALLMTSKKRWFRAGFCGSLAFLTWQAMGIFPIVTLFLAAISPEKERFQNIFRTTAGVVIPLIFIIFYFYFYGAFWQFLDGAILFNIKYIDRKTTSLFYPIFRLIYVVGFRYNTLLLPILIGLIMIIYLSLRKIPRYFSFRALLNRDPFAPLLITFPAPLLWSLIDFQGIPDFFVFIPYISIGFGYFIEVVFQRVKGFFLKNRSHSSCQRAPQFFLIGLVVVLITLAEVNISLYRNSELDNQKKGAIEIERRFGKEVRFLSIGTPELLVLLHWKNPNPYVFIISGIDRYIHEKTNDGFEGWLKELEVFKPEVIGFGETYGRHTPKLMDWINSNYHPEQVGPWHIYVRNQK
jgi:hypothetical protein